MRNTPIPKKAQYLYSSYRGGKLHKTPISRSARTTLATFSHSWRVQDCLMAYQSYFFICCIHVWLNCSLKVFLQTWEKGRSRKFNYILQQNMEILWPHYLIVFRWLMFAEMSKTQNLCSPKVLNFFHVCIYDSLLCCWIQYISA